MLKNLLVRNEGQGMAEYALILALVAILAIVGLMVLGPKVQDLLMRISGSL